jgi:two-component system response regulator YesN
VTYRRKWAAIKNWEAKVMLSGSRVKLRFIVICILLGTIPAIIVGAFSVYRGSQTVRDKVNESNMRNLVQVQMSVEQLLFSADHVMIQFIETPAIKASLSVELTGEQFCIFNTVEDTVNNLPTYSLGASEICLANLNKSWAIDNSGIYSLKDYPGNPYLNEFIKMSGSTLWVNGLSMNITADNAVKMDSICLVKKWPLFVSNPSYLAILKIPYSKLASLISDNNALGLIMILGEDGHVIVHPEKEEWGKDYNSVEYYRRLADKTDPAGSFTITIDDVDYSVNYLRSEYNNWTYLSVTSLSDLLKDSKAIGWFTFFACLAVAAVVNVAAFIISNRMYKPVEKLYLDRTR